MNILLSTDNNYVMPTGVLMHSIGENNKVNIDYYVMVNSDFDLNNKKILTDIAAKYCSNVTYYTINEEMTKILPFEKEGMPSHVSVATYFRLFVTQFLPESVDRILYLDGDMIVRDSLAPLYNSNIEESPVVVAHDMDERIHLKTGRLTYEEQYGYFNAGMMLINVKYWRDNHCLQLFMNFIKENGNRIVFHDQDVLNCVFAKTKKWTSVTYNFQNGFIHKKGALHCPDGIDVRNCMHNPCIIHYTTSEKPWFEECMHPFKGEWLKYKAISQWAKEPLQTKKVVGFKQNLRRLLIKIGVWKPRTPFIQVHLTNI